MSDGLDRGEVVRLSLEELQTRGFEVNDTDIQSLDAEICSTIYSILKYGKIHLPNLGLAEAVESVVSRIVESYGDLLSFNSTQFMEIEGYGSGNVSIEVDEDKLEQYKRTRDALKKLFGEVGTNLNIEKDSVFRRNLIIFQRTNNLSDDQMAGQFKISNSTYSRWIQGIGAPRNNTRKSEIFQMLREYPENWMV